MEPKRKLGGVELEILNIVWERNEATVADVLDVIRGRRDAAYTTVMTTMRNLAQKGLLTHRTEGRTFVYSAAVSPEEIKRSLLKDTVDKVFGGSSVELVQNLLEDESLTDDDVERLKKIIEELK